MVAFASRRHHRRHLVLQRHAEPFTWGIPRAELPAFLAAHGFELLDLADENALRDRYLAPYWRTCRSPSASSPASRRSAILSGWRQSSLNQRAETAVGDALVRAAVLPGAGQPELDGEPVRFAEGAAVELVAAEDQDVSRPAVERGDARQPRLVEDAARDGIVGNVHAEQVGVELGVSVARHVGQVENDVDAVGRQVEPAIAVDE